MITKTSGNGGHRTGTKKDFSWEALGDIRWAGWSVDDTQHVVETLSGRRYASTRDPYVAPTIVREAKLQDYWRADVVTGKLRDDAGMGAELITALDGVRFHCVHFPAPVPVDATSGKPGWTASELNFLLSRRLDIAAPTQWDGPVYRRRIVGADQRAQFQGAVFLGAFARPGGPAARLWVDCSGAQFAGLAIFDRQVFADGTFEHARFLKDAFFEYCVFEKDAVFSDSIFEANSTFLGVEFKQEAWFPRVTFRGKTSFQGAIMNLGAFSNTLFKRSVTFAASTIGKSIAFSETRFLELHRIGFRAGLPQFLGIVSLVVAIVVAMTLHGSASLLAWMLAPALVVFLMAWSSIGGAMSADGRRTVDERQLGTRDWRYPFKALATKINEGDRQLRAHQFSFRALGRHAQDSGDEHLRQIAYSLELKASRLRPGATVRDWVLTKPADRVTSLLYELCADYGRSIGRPIIWLVGITILFAALAWVSGSGAFRPSPRTAGAGSTVWSLHVEDLTPAGLLSAFDYSASRAVPFGAWLNMDKADGDTCTFNLNLQAAGKCRPANTPLADPLALEAYRFFAHGLAATQTIISTVLIVLFGLSLRRRFQIKS